MHGVYIEPTLSSLPSVLLANRYSDLTALAADGELGRSTPNLQQPTGIREQHLIDFQYLAQILWCVRRDGMRGAETSAVEDPLATGRRDVIWRRRREGRIMQTAAYVGDSVEDGRNGVDQHQ